MSNLECSVQLPSLGKPYGDPALEGDIVLKMISGKVEKKIFGSSVPNVLDYLLEECIVSPKFDVTILTTEDRLFLLTKLRIHSYGPEYHISYQCPNCEEERNFEYSLDDIEIRELEGEYEDTWTINLPMTEDVITVRNLRAGDYDKITNRVNKISKQTKVSKNEQNYLTRLAYPIVEINGKKVFIQEAENYIENLPGRDLEAIRKSLNTKYDYGYQSEVVVTCPKCGSDFTAPVLMTSEFFRPSGY